MDGRRATGLWISHSTLNEESFDSIHEYIIKNQTWIWRSWYISISNVVASNAGDINPLTQSAVGGTAVGIYFEDSEIKSRFKESAVVSYYILILQYILTKRKISEIFGGNGGKNNGNLFILLYS